MKTERGMTQTELAERWRLSEATLERWRTESAGPLFLKLGNQVRYRLADVEAFEEAALLSRAEVSSPSGPKRLILETSVGRVRVCVWCVVWQGATRRHGCSLQGGATQPGGAPGVQSDA